MPKVEKKKRRWDNGDFWDKLIKNRQKNRDAALRLYDLTPDPSPEMRGEKDK